MGTNIITLTISGPNTPEQQLIAELVQDALVAAGVRVRHDPVRGVLHARSLDQLWNAAVFCDSIIQIRESEAP